MNKRITEAFEKGKAFIKNSKTYTITDISESLNPDECKVYDNGVLMTNFTYSEADKSLSYTLDKGRHNLSFVLVDEAGNSYTVQEVSFIQVGLFYCLWFVKAGYHIGVHSDIKREFVTDLACEFVAFVNHNNFFVCTVYAV